MYICNECGKEFSLNPEKCDNCGVIVSPDTFRIEIPTPYPSSVDSDEEMHLNMQLYMEYCLYNDYITPKEWLDNHKTF